MIDLIAQAEAVMEGVTPGPWETSCARWPEQIGCCPLVGRPVSAHHNMRNVAAANTDADIRFIAWCRAGVPALIARIRELEGDNARFWSANLALQRSRDTAEAKLAEVEKERRRAANEAELLRHYKDSHIKAEERAFAAEAKVAAVEKERDAAREDAAMWGGMKVAAEAKVARLDGALRDMISGYEEYDVPDGKRVVRPIEKQSPWIQRARAALTEGDTTNE
jgi:hypothetical protein